MQNTDVGRLLNDIKMLIVADRAERFSQGKEFNVFRIQGILSDEVKICRLIRELLDPKGSHGQGFVFLKLFLKRIGFKHFSELTETDFKMASVKKEERIDDNRRIDLVIHVNHHIIPIEVKVYAEDQNRQCYDYYEYVVKKDAHTVIYYLTLDGHEPSDESKVDLNTEQYKCISFQNEIIDWLSDCINSTELEQIYPVREIIIQFRDILRNITGTEKGKIRMEIKDKISSSSENFDAALQIVNTFRDVMTEKMREVFDAIKKHMDMMGYSGFLIHEAFFDEAKKYYENKSESSWPSLNYLIPTADESIKSRIVLRFEIKEKLYFGVCTWSATEKNNWSEGIYSKEIEKKVRDELMPVDNAKGAHEIWYWRKFYAEDIDFRNCTETYKQLYNRQIFDEIMQKAFDEIDSAIKTLMG